MGQCKFEVGFKYSIWIPILQRAVIISTKCIELTRIKSVYYSDYFEVRHPHCVEPKLKNGKNTVKTQLYISAMRGWIT